jgi:hypothetical protein
MKTLGLISKNRAFAHVRILAAVLFVLAAAALVFLAVSPARYCSADCSTAAANSKILSSGGF